MGNNNVNERYGLRIIKILEHSPASTSNLQIYSDFIVDILEKSDNFVLERDFYKFIIDHENKTVNFKVFNILTKDTRVVAFMPSRDWPNADFLLGFKVRNESITAANENIYRISGIKNQILNDRIFVHDDFFIAMSDVIYKNLEELKEKLQFLRKAEVVVFNLHKIEVRVVEIDIVPLQGLGFEISSGYLHDLSFILANSQKSLDLNSKEGPSFGNAEKSQLISKTSFENTIDKSNDYFLHSSVTLKTEAKPSDHNRHHEGLAKQIDSKTNKNQSFTETSEEIDATRVDL
jgi:hypothetical protein